MQRKHIITISGKPGSGKSSTSDKVSELLGYTRHSSGDMVRNALKKHKMSLAEYNDETNTEFSLDEEVDEALRELRIQKDVVVDSRLGFYWLPESFKVYLDLDLEIATARIFKDTVSNQMRRDVGTSSSSLAGVTRQVRERMLAEQNRFRNLYGVDPYNKNHFDLVIDTSRQNPQSVAIAVFDSYRKWLDSEVWEPKHNSVPLRYSFKNQY